MTSPDGKDPKAPPAGIKLGFGGVEGHGMRHDEARRRVIDKFADSQPVDDRRYQMSTTGGSSDAEAQLFKLHPMVAGQRAPKKPLFRLYVRLIAEANVRDPLTADETRKLRRELVLTEPTAEGAQLLLDKYC